MITVSIDKIGNLEFPDNTKQEVINRVVKDLVAKKKETDNPYKNKTPIIGPIIDSLKNAYKIAGEETTQGIESMSKALEEPTGKNLFKGAMGALQYGFSPLTGAAKGLLGQPTEEGLKQLGVNETVSKIAGNAMETAAYFIPYGKIVQGVIETDKAIASAKEAQEVMKRLSIKPVTKEVAKKPLEFPEGISAQTIMETTKPLDAGAKKEILKPSVIKEVNTELKTIISETWKPQGSKRITQEIVDLIVSNPDEITKVSNKYNLSAQELAAQIKDTMSTSGRELNRMSQLAKEIRAKYNTPYMKQLADSMEKDLPEVTVLDKFGSGFRTLENFRRAGLVTQFATTMRNIISQGATLGLDTIDKSFQGTMNGFLKSAGARSFDSVVSTLRGMGEGLDNFTATISRLSSKERAKLVEILETTNAVKAKALMFNTPIQDVALTGKISRTLNYLNTTQEYFFRNIAFEAKLRGLVKKAGLDYKSVNATDIPEKMLEESAEYALKMTYAAMPKSQFGREWIRSMSNPIMTAFLNPFPRFLWGNALPFLKRFSPIGFIDAFSPKTVAGIVSGNTDKFAKSISEATLGTVMLQGASWLRNSEYAGEKWYEIDINGKYYDMRAYAPFSTYLFIAEALNNPDRIKPADFGTALLSLNRIAGTGLVITDILRGDNAVNSINTLKRLAGEYTGSFTVPLRTPKDLYTIIDPEESITRDIKASEFIGPIMRNIPEVSQKLPEARSPLKVGTMKTEHPVLRQFTGLSKSTKTALQKEVDTLQLKSTKVYPSTGDAQGDIIVSEVMSKVLEPSFNKLITQTNYNQLDNITKKIILGELFSDSKKYARKQLSVTNPDIATKIKIDDIPQEYKELLKSKGIISK